MTTQTIDTTLTPNTEFVRLVTDEQIARTVQALEANKFKVLMANNIEDAKKMFFELLPEGANIHMAASKTLEVIGVTEVVEQSGRYNAIRPKLRAMDRKTQADEIRRLGASPDYMAGSVQALTEDGHALIASFGGSQIGPYASGAGKVIWVVGVQKIVKDVTEGLRRIQEYSLPLEDVRLQKAFNLHSAANKVLIYNADVFPRTTIILVKEQVGD
jgi:hypothetical protein